MIYSEKYFYTFNSTVIFISDYNFLWSLFIFKPLSKMWIKIMWKKDSVKNVIKLYKKNI